MTEDRSNVVLYPWFLLCWNEFITEFYLLIDTIDIHQINFIDFSIERAIDYVEHTRIVADM